MTPDTLFCAGCGATLAAPDSVCTACEQALAPPSDDPASGTYRCPACSCRFDRLAVGNWWPPQARWYLPQTMKPQCPHCQAFLRDQWVGARTRAETVVLVVAAIAAVVSGSMPLLLLALGVVLLVGAMGLLRGKRARSAVAVEDRYAVQETGR